MEEIHRNYNINIPQQTTEKSLASQIKHLEVEIQQLEKKLVEATGARKNPPSKESKIMAKSFAVQLSTFASRLTPSETEKKLSNAIAKAKSTLHDLKETQKEEQSEIENHPFHDPAIMTRKKASTPESTPAAPKTTKPEKKPVTRGESEPYLDPFYNPKIMSREKEDK